MNFAGCKRKFDVDGYISYVKRLVSETKKRKAASSVSTEPTAAKIRRAPPKVDE